MSILNKAIDSLIDDLFADNSMSKSNMIKDQKPQKETADESVNEAPKSESDEARGAGRPKQINDVPKVDTDGKRAKKYDADIAEAHGSEENKEVSQVKVPELMKKAISDVQFAEYQELKKARAESEKEEVLKKARQENSDLIKSAVKEATYAARQENAELRKSLEEQGELIKSIANRPQKSKAITSNIQAVEKFEKSSSNSKMSKSDLLDVAEELVKSKQLTMEHAIELENTGFIYDAEARGILERAAKRRN